MSTTTENQTASPHPLKAPEFQWLIENYDHRRGSIATRATMVVIANSIVFAAVAQVIAGFEPQQGLSQVVSSLFSVCALCAALASVIMSVQCTVNLRSQAKMFGKAQRGIFHPRSAHEKYHDLDGFKKHFPCSEDELLDCMKEHLWVLMCEYGYRYDKLRLASRTLIAAFCLLSATLVSITPARVIVLPNGTAIDTYLDERQELNHRMHGSGGGQTVLKSTSTPDAP